MYSEQRNVCFLLLPNKKYTKTHGKCKLFIAQAVVWQFMEQHWGHTVLLSADEQWQRAKRYSTGACGRRRGRQGKAQLVERCWSPRRLSVPVLPAGSSTEQGSSGVWSSAHGLGARCERAVRGLWDFPAGFVEMRIFQAASLTGGLSRKLLFQSLVFVVLSPLVWVSLCVMDLWGKGGFVPVQPGFNHPCLFVCMWFAPFSFVC